MARVHMDARRATYEGVMSDDIVNGWSHEKSARALSAQLSLLGDDGMAFVAIVSDTGEVAGFSVAGPRRSHGGHREGELYALYVDPLRQRRGIGERLMAQTANFLTNRGFTRMTAWTLSINPARAFYEKLGGAFQDERRVEIKGQTLHEVSYGWRLADLCRPGAD